MLLSWNIYAKLTNKEAHYSCLLLTNTICVLFINKYLRISAQHAEAWHLEQSVLSLAGMWFEVTVHVK